MCIFLVQLNGGRTPATPTAGHATAFSRLRCSSHNLRIESGMHNNTELAQRICVLCNLYSIEDKFYFLMNCTAYTFIAPHISDFLPSFENFVKLMQSEETICTKDVACYI